MRFFAKIGAARKVAAGNAKKYAAAPIMGLVVVKNEDQDFIFAGRVIERIWLKAARLGFGLHLITGTMFFWQGINLGDLKIFSEKHRRIINEEYKTLANIAGVKEEDELVTAILRIGSSGEPTALSTKKLPLVKYG
jgi:hypothetical protein